VTILLVTISLHAERGGGTAERTRQLAQHLAALGTPCEVVTMEDGRHADDLRARGIPVHVTGHVHIRYHLPFLNPFRLSALVDRADRVHILGYWNLLSVAIAWLARAAGRPYALSPAGEFASLDAPHPAARLFHRTVGRALIRHAAMLIAITPLEQRQIAARSPISRRRWSWSRTGCRSRRRRRRRRPRRGRPSSSSAGWRRSRGPICSSRPSPPSPRRIPTSS
jgi:hypothetical protein